LIQAQVLRGPILELQQLGLKLKSGVAVAVVVVPLLVVQEVVAAVVRILL
jgi:hypothetical protein